MTGQMLGTAGTEILGYGNAFADQFTTTGGTLIFKRTAFNSLRFGFSKALYGRFSATGSGQVIFYDRFRE